MSDSALLNVIAWMGVAGAVGLPITRQKYALTARDIGRAVRSDVPAIISGVACAIFFLVAGVRHQMWAVIAVSPVLGLICAEAVHAIREYWPRRPG